MHWRTTTMVGQRSLRRIPAQFCMALFLCILGLPAIAQEPQATPPWQVPDVSSLTLGWWDQFEITSPEDFQERMGRFVALTEDKLQGLEGDDFVTAKNLLSKLQDQDDMLVLVLRETPPEPFEPIATKEFYTLDELLSLRQQWRDIEARQEVPQLRVGELERQATLLEQHRDDLLRQYNSIDVNSPARILLGLQRVSARMEYELTKRNLEKQEGSLDQFQQQSQLLDDQIEYAQARLESGETDWHAIENKAIEAHADVAAIADKMTTLQHQLLDVLSAEAPKPSLELLRKQQLTRAAASQSLARIQENLYRARANWYRFHSGALDFQFDIEGSIAASDSLVKQARKQVEVWTAASQTTLLSPLPSSGLNARKNVELAHTVAQETLAIIGGIADSSDDLMLVQKTLTSDMVDVQSGFQSLRTRLTIFSGSVGKSVFSVLEFNLFHIGDAPVTPGGIITMLMILIFGYALSWFIRHLLERLNNRRQYAKSPVVYTLGRVLHYIIIITAVFVALGSIGLDFTNFALIAGALSVGIGFGLQSIVNNFVSGLILLFEGSLRVGDFVELDSGLRGTVKEINTRATIITTNDSMDVVVPNSEFVSTRLTNWTLRESIARLRIRFGVAYGSDKDTVREAALEAASEVEYILLQIPGREAQVRLVDFGDSSLDFEFLFWVKRTGVQRPGRVRAEFMWVLETKLREKGIEIPFPQRDLHLRSGFTQAPGDEAERLLE